MRAGDVASGSARSTPRPGFTEELMHLYLATDLTPAGDGDGSTPDDDEHLLLERRPWRDAVAAAERGEIVDAKSIVGLLLARAAPRRRRVRTAMTEGVRASRPDDVGRPARDHGGEPRRRRDPGLRPLGHRARARPGRAGPRRDGRGRRGRPGRGLLHAAPRRPDDPSGPSPPRARRAPRAGGPRGRSTARPRRAPAVRPAAPPGVGRLRRRPRVPLPVEPLAVPAAGGPRGPPAVVPARRDHPPLRSVGRDRHRRVGRLHARRLRGPPDADDLDAVGDRPRQRVRPTSTRAGSCWSPRSMRRHRPWRSPGSRPTPRRPARWPATSASSACSPPGADAVSAGRSLRWAVADLRRRGAGRIELSVEAANDRATGVVSRPRLRARHRVAALGAAGRLSRSRGRVRQPGASAAQARQRVAVERRVRAQRDGEPQVRAGLGAPPEPLEALAAARSARSAPTGRSRAARSNVSRARSGWFGVEVRPTERLEDRAPCAGSSRSARSRTIAACAWCRLREQGLAALEQLVGALAPRPSGSRRSRTLIHRPMVPRNRGRHADGAPRAAARAGRRRGLRLAVGREVDRLEPRRFGQPGDPAALGDRPAVDLLDVAGEVDRRRAADVRPDGVRVDRRAGLLEVRRSGRASARPRRRSARAGSRPGRAGRGPRGRGRR